MRRERKLAAEGRTEAGADGGADRDDGTAGLIRQLESIASDGKTPAAVQVAAIRAIHDLKGAAQTDRPTTVAQVEALSTEDLHALVRRLELAHRLPVDPEPA